MWCLCAFSRAWSRLVFELLPLMFNWPICHISSSCRAWRTPPVTASGATGHRRWSAVDWRRWPSAAPTPVPSSACQCPAFSPSGSAGRPASTSMVKDWDTFFKSLTGNPHKNLFLQDCSVWGGTPAGCGYPSRSPPNTRPLVVKSLPTSSPVSV